MNSMVTRRSAAPTAEAELARRSAPLSPPSPNWLGGWKATDTLPAAARAEAEACIPGLEASLAPVSPKAMAMVLTNLLDWVADFGIVALPVDEGARRAFFTRLAARYREHLGHLPEDLLAQCVDETMASHRFRNLPLPADMIARVSAELGRRRNALGACRLALKLNRFEAPPIAPEDRVKPEQARALRMELAAAAAAREMPDADTLEDGEPPTPPNPRMDRGASA